MGLPDHLMRPHLRLTHASPLDAGHSS